MEKYLFTDGTNVVREVQSKEELQSLMQASGDTGKIRIWVFSTSEWISFAEFSKHNISNNLPLKKAEKAERKTEPVAIHKPPKAKQSSWPLKLFIMLITAGAIFLVYNFTREKWHHASPLTIEAGYPENVPQMNIDSLLFEIEMTRGQKLDKVTTTNLRIRNSWPDRVLLKLTTDRDTSLSGSKFFNLEVAIDNSTGYHIDKAVVEVKNWKNSSLVNTDTVYFSNINYTAPVRSKLNDEYRGDSLSVSFLSLKAKSFNFCYAYDKESNYGNFNDRWFCRD